MTYSSVKSHSSWTILLVYSINASRCCIVNQYFPSVKGRKKRKSSTKDSTNPHPVSPCNAQNSFSTGGYKWHWMSLFLILFSVTSSVASVCYTGTHICWSAAWYALVLNLSITWGEVVLHVFGRLLPGRQEQQEQQEQEKVNEVH